MSWNALHVHSQYSILDSTASVSSLAKQAAAFSMSALALTDFCNMFGAVDFFKACRAAGVKPIIGCEVMVAPFSRGDKKKMGNHSLAYPLIFLAKNQLGYQNLCKISSIGYLEGFYYTPRVDKEVLEAHSEGLICLSGPISSRISQNIVSGKEEDLLQEIEWSQKVYGEDFYFELQRHRMSDAAITQDGIDNESWLYQSYLDRVQNQEKVIARLLELSKEKGIRTVATNDSHYLQRDDWKAHEILLNVQSGQPCEIVETDSYGNPIRRNLNPKRRAFSSHEHYFKSPEEIAALFSDIPEAVAETLKIAEQCNLELDFKTKFYPVYVPPHLEGKDTPEEERVKEAASYLRELCAEGIKKRYTPERLAKVQEKYPGQDPLEVVKKRLEHELTIITTQGMCDYLLIVRDFIAWAKKQGIPVGPGRGSGVGSIILYLIEITDMEPLRFNLVFERFINPERLSYPDIDVDICMDRRSEVIDYTLNKYGKDKVAQIITFGTMKAKMAIKDVGRVLSVPLAKVNDIAKLVPEDPGMTLAKAFELEPQLSQLAEVDEDAGRILSYAKKLEGSIRNTGIHAAGLIICGDPLTDHIPVCNAKDSEMSVTQYSMKPVESVGMLKIDFLGLKTLTSIKKTVDAIEKSTGDRIDWVDLNLEDENTFSLLNHGKTLGVFQLESSGMQELAKQMHIDKFEDIVAAGALYRPGPMEMIPSFINRKKGKEKIEVDHPLMADVIAETYGIMVYQEQVMQIASRLAGYSLGEGDVLRRAMGKKDKVEMARQREKFQLGALQAGIEEQKSLEIFDKIEKFASYGFNKSHAVAYAYLSYVTAYLKANYPKQWLAALMTCDIDDLTKVAKHIRESEAMQIKILSPDVNESDSEFVATEGGIRFAMSGIKGVGKGVVANIIAERKKNGPFSSLYDFLLRIDTAKVGKKVVEHLILAGSFDFTGWKREALLVSVEPMFHQAVREQKEKAAGVLDFLSVLEDPQDAFENPPEIDTRISKADELAKEKELLGFYLNGHPMDEYQELIGRLAVTPLHEMHTSSKPSVCKSAFIIETVKVKISAKTQKKFAILTIGDGMEHFELPIWADVYHEKQALFTEGQLIVAILKVENTGDSIRLQCKNAFSLSTLNEEEIAAVEDSYKEALSRLKFEGKKKKEQKEAMEQEDKSHLKVVVDANFVRMTEIIKLKKTFERFAGQQAVNIEFHSDQKKVGAIEVTSKWGVQKTGALEEALKQMSFIQSFSFVS